MQAYQDLNARIQDFSKSNPRLHYLVCGWSTGPGGLLRNATLADLTPECLQSPACVEEQLTFKRVRTERFVSDGIHPTLAGAPTL